MLAALAGRVPAQPAVEGALCNIAIDWQAPSNCPDRDAFAMQLGAELGASPARWIQLAVRIDRRDGRYVLTWSMGIGAPDAAGRSPLTTEERLFADPSCAVVVDTAATVVALSIAPFNDGAVAVGDRAVAPGVDRSGGGRRDLLPGPCPQARDRDVPGDLFDETADGEGA
ncbi:MAG: hypothetical protein AAGC55_25005, partial [Myxococcota bacterium]